MAKQQIQATQIKPIVAFKATANAAFNATNATPTITNLGNVNYNYGNGFNPTTGIFTAPVSGIYSFECTVYFEATSTTRGFIATTTSGTTDIPNGSFQLTDFDTTRTRTLNASVQGYMAAGATIAIQAYSNSTTNINNQRTHFAGHLVAAV